MSVNEHFVVILSIILMFIIQYLSSYHSLFYSIEGYKIFDYKWSKSVFSYIIWMQYFMFYELIYFLGFPPQSVDEEYFLTNLAGNRRVHKHTLTRDHRSRRGPH